MNEDELIYRIRFEGDTTDISSLIDPNALQGLVDLGKEIEATKEQLDSYQKQVKLGFPLSEEDRKNVEQLKLKLNDLRKEYQDNQKAVTNNDKALKANSNTYDGLVERNKALSQAMRELPLDDTTGALQRMQAEYNANNDVLKEFDASMGNHQRNVGNYKDAFEGLGGVFSMLPDSMQGISAAFMGTASALDFAEKSTSQADGGFKAFFKTLISNPIGLIIIAVTALLGFLSKLKPVTEALEKVFAVLGATVDTVVGYFEALISGTDTSTISFRNNARAALEALAAQKKLAAMEAKAAKVAAGYNSAIETQRQIVEDTTKSSKERIAALIQMQALLVRQKDAEIALAKAAFDSAKKNKADIKEVNDAEAAYNQLLTDRRALIYDQKIELADFKAQFQVTNEVVVEGLSEQLELQKNLAAIYAEQAEEFEKQNAALLDYENIKIGDSWKQFENNVKLFDIEREFQNEMTQQRIDAATKRGDLLMALELRMQQDIFNLTARFMDAGLDYAEAKAKAKAQIEIKYAQEVADTTSQIAQQNEDDRIGNMMKIAKAGTEIANSLFQENKKVAISTAIIDTLAAAVNVMRSPGNIYVKLAQSAAILAAGYANVRKIIATQPGSTSGGSSVPTANMGPAMPMGMIGSAFNPSQAMRFGPLTTGAAGSAAPFNARETQGITVYANVDRKGLAIAVREGERQIKTQQFTFAQ
jgi:hypothetical protein